MPLFLQQNELSGSLPAELTKLTTLQTFHFNDTNLCEPPGTKFQTWLAGIPDVQSTGVICQMTVTPEEGGTESSSDDFASVFFPPGAVLDDIYVSIVQVAEASVPPANEGFELLGSAYDFNAYDAEGNLITEFEGMITITLYYDPADLNGLLEQDLQIMYYDTLLAGWVPIPSTVNTVDHLVSGETDHFTLFGIFGIVVPEPTTSVLFGTGLLGILILVRRKRNTRK